MRVPEVGLTKELQELLREQKIKRYGVWYCEQWVTPSFKVVSAAWKAEAVFMIGTTPRAVLVRGDGVEQVERKLVERVRAVYEKEAARLRELAEELEQ